MAQYSFQGSLNTASLIVPDLYIQTSAPSILTIQGAPTNLIGYVGTSSYGPIGLPVVGGNLSDYQRTFGGVQARKYDMGTHVATAIQQGAAAFYCVRVTDGTDTAATAPSQINNTVVSPSFVAPFTGSGGAGTTIMVNPGRTPGSWGATVSRPGRVPERYDNNCQSWGDLITAINNGVPNQPASQLVIAVTGGATIAGVPSLMNFVLSGGSDGAGTIGPAQIVGNDGLVPTGAFALRGQGCSIGVCADLDTTSYWPTVDALGLSEGIYFMHPLPSGLTVTAAGAVPGTLGLSPFSKILHGDWIYWYDTTNQLTRLVSPQGFEAGMLANLGPQESSLNKVMQGIIGSQYTGVNGGNAYSEAELQVLGQAGIDLITNPAPGGAYWAARFGHNASLNVNFYGDSYPRLTTFLVRSLAQSMGAYVGELISLTLLQNMRASLLGFLQSLLDQGILVTRDGRKPYTVVCDQTNNTSVREGLGYAQADVSIQYPGIADKILINIQGGPQVVIVTQN